MTIHNPNINLVTENDSKINFIFGNKVSVFNLLVLLILISVGILKGTMFGYFFIFLSLLICSMWYRREEWCFDPKSPAVLVNNVFFGVRIRGKSLFLSVDGSFIVRKWSKSLSPKHSSTYELVYTNKEEDRIIITSPDKGLLEKYQKAMKIAIKGSVESNST